MNRRALGFVGCVVSVLLGGALGSWAPEGFAAEEEAAMEDAAPQGGEEQLQEAAVDAAASGPVTEEDNWGDEEFVDWTEEDESPRAETTDGTKPDATNELISIDFKDADVRQVLRIIALKSGIDIVAGPDVEGLVTIKLTNVPWEQALDIILKTYGFTYERKGRIVRVLTLAAIDQEALDTEVYPLSYATASEITDVLSDMLSDRGKVRYDERTNTVIVIDVPAVLTKLKQVVERLDRATPQVYIETRFVETILTKDENLGFEWSSSINPQWTLPELTGVFPYPGQIPAARRAADGAITLGTLKWSDFGATLQILNDRSDTKVISKPTIVTLNNQEATVQVGTDVNIPNFQIDPSTGRATVTGFETRSTGIILRVTPHVNPRNEIVMDLEPEITTIGAPRTFSTGGTSDLTFPDFNVQKVKTQVRLNNGDTLAIGGLKRNSRVTTVQKMPILGDIPFLSWLFTRRREQIPADQSQRDLLIFLTVRLIEASDEMNYARTAPRFTLPDEVYPDTLGDSGG